MNFKTYAWPLGILVGGLLAITAKNYGYHLDLHLNHQEIESSIDDARFSGYMSQRDLKALKEREYLNSSQYKEYRDWCDRNGLPYMQYEIDRDRANGGTMDHNIDRGND